jgi:2-polyprenyl-6-methoxyphenol hydroxylase-like FAD-dependent oxidoreductase
MELCDVDVIVVGGGIAGLTVAICLKKEGFACHVYEGKSIKPSTTSAIVLSASGVRVLHSLGLSPSLEAKGQKVRRMRTFTSHLELVAELNMLGQEQYGHDGIAMTRRVLHNILTEECKRLAIPVDYDCKLTSVSQDDAGVVARFGNGLAVRGRLLVGADGIGSAVRSSIFLKLELERKDRLYFGCGALIPTSFLTEKEQITLRLAEGSMNLINGTKGFVGFIGIGCPEKAGETKFLFWSHISRAQVDADFDSRDLKAVKDVLLRLRGSWCELIEKVINLLDQQLPGVEVMCGPIFSNGPIPEWSNGRVVLIGDAAHGYGPGASGAALAMEDALLLAKMLKRSKFQSDKSFVGLRGVFQEFESKRRPRVESIGNAAEARNDARFVDQGWLKIKVKEYLMWLYGWWYANGYYDATNAYKAEDDL